MKMRGNHWFWCWTLVACVMNRFANVMRWLLGIWCVEHFFFFFFRLWGEAMQVRMGIKL